MDWITSKHMKTADIEMHLGLTYANCTTGAQNKTVGDFFLCVWWLGWVDGWGLVVCVCVGGGGVGWSIPFEYYVVGSQCACSHDSLMIYNAVNLGRTWVDYQYFPHVGPLHDVGPESTCCGMHKNFDPWNSRQNKQKSQVYRIKTFGLSLGFHELWYLKQRLQ